MDTITATTAGTVTFKRNPDTGEVTIILSAVAAANAHDVLGLIDLADFSMPNEEEREDLESTRFALWAATGSA